jgi:hypothetical protein
MNEKDDKVAGRIVSHITFNEEDWIFGCAGSQAVPARPVCKVRLKERQSVRKWSR